ncbi:spore germination protein [Sporomusa acidovorans]|uniref:Spore germination protein B1 n=1 Tax=Sporomusa acidovorans (strain ATCC 49682 / DSM 3132 / Mol) TaxID=1123286 RepID=A0ABZ3IXF8_SPOA4|nr:spore germination protein [Sporomusa acidovorans]OZC23677.1 spore germination protein B1 [Sporomusa acidovorans DSM 3132]SDE24903.1 spore germination protein [Sporomusa acidovorans]
MGLSNTKKTCSFRKLSDILPGNSLDTLKVRVAALKQLVKDSTELGEDMSGIVAELRAVPAAGEEQFLFTPQLGLNVQLLKTIFRDCDDVKFRFFKTAGRQALLVTLDGMTDTPTLEDNILQPLMQAPAGNFDLRRFVEERLTVTNVTIEDQGSAAIEALMSGNALVMIDGIADILSVSATKHVKRSVSTPVTEENIRGPQDAFNETLADNIVLIRRRAKDTNIKVRVITVGTRSKTSVAVIYSAALVKPGLVEEVERRIKDLKVDQVLVSKVVEDAMVDHPWTPFPQLDVTERPEKVVAAVYEGRVGVLVDNTPFSIIVPCTYASMMNAVEDYTMPASVACLVRVSRHVAAFIAIYTPALYIAIVSFHPGMLPTGLAISLAELRARTPFPSFLEAIIMEIMLELFQESVARLPKKLSSAASMVGAFVIGTTVVQAGLVNPFLVVVTAITAIASYVMPHYSLGLALRSLRIPILFLASTLGLYGVMLGVIIITVHLCSLKNFGESYLGGILDVNLLTDWKDGFVRLPHKFMKSRPVEFGAQDKKRRGDGTDYGQS